MENKNLEAINLNNLGKIFSIAYVKLYIKYLAEIYIYNKINLSFQEIINTISSNENNSRKIVKIFFFKNCLQYFENYSKFNDSIMKDEEFPFRKEYKDNRPDPQNQKIRSEKECEELILGVNLSYLNIS